MNVKFLSTVIAVCLYNLAWAQSEAPQVIPGQYIVTLKETAVQPLVLSITIESENRQDNYNNSDQQRQTGLAKIREVESAARIDAVNVIAEYMDVIVGFTAKMDQQQVQILRSNPAVDQVIEDYSFQIEPTPEEETPGEVTANAGQVQTCAVTNAGGFSDGSSKSTWIWIVDTGVDLDHPDLNVLSTAPYAKSFVSGQTIDDQNGHGSHVAGIAAAKNNNFGVVGVSAGATVVPVKVLSNSGGGSFSALLSGLNHVATYKHTNDVVNMSVGAFPVANCQTSNPALFTAIKNLGNAKVWVCIAAGNDGCDALQNVPGCFNSTRVYTVGSMTCGQECSSFSNFNKTVVDWLATGNAVYSTFKNGLYATLSGTSMATPVVAGICHARVAPPLSGGLVSCGNNCVTKSSYKKAKRQ
jgi:subtilisin family serine protease